MSFIDTRLHICIRPTLEYLVPEVGRNIKRCLVGDISASDTLPTLECCVFPLEEGGVTSFVEDDDDVIKTLRSCMSDTISLTHDYLSEMILQWKNTLSTTQSHIMRIAQSFKEERLAAYRVREKYRTQNHKMVDDEFFTEIERILSSLDESLQRVRDAEEPSPARPETFVASCEKLRTAFAESYGKCPTKKLMALKKDFEQELIHVQRGLSEDFVIFCTRMLQG